MEKLLSGTVSFQTIMEDARADRRAHAVLVVFPDAEYLRPLLRMCAKAFFLAEEGTRTARLLDEENYPDCLFLPEPQGKLTAEAGARILEESALLPMEGDKKLFVLDRFQTVTPLVQNKLLKVFEEPPEGVYFLLGTTNAHAVLPTVVSRMKKIEEPPFSKEELVSALKRMHPEGARAEEAAAASGGMLSAAERLLSGGGESFSLAERFLSGEAETVSRALEKGDISAFLSALRQLLYDMLLLSTGKERYAIGSEAARRLQREYPAGAILSALALVEKAEREATFNANAAQCALALAVGIGKEKARWQKLSR